jgi:hypothetical protein
MKANEAAYTPGPWKVSPQHREVDGLWEPNGIDIEGADGSSVVGPEGIFAGANDEANSKLIAAAPLLVEALYAIVRDLPSNKDWLDPVTEALARDALKTPGIEVTP